MLRQTVTCSSGQLLLTSSIINSKMTETPQVSVSNILSSIEGHEVDFYGDVDAAKRVMPIPEEPTRDAVDMANKTPACGRDKKLGPFLVSAYRSLANVGEALGEISAKFQTAWLSHYDDWVPKVDHLTEDEPGWTRFYC